ncbi:MULTISPECIES: MIP/aquaporin family protein [Streptomyces]|uniref:Aquaporin family protein n=1 Tax=Streptomyces rimosus subsp. rimosus (strain ATCC 10970 / DSM 40260 / JCM 4667 / NRRL 2234) TaxID=1265868 RepID=L8EGQ4_STRR1|nr:MULTISPECIES: MIP/aquaporin family protein [Streptomyces]KOG72008.1 glycerol transporter [Kitasatospora aureofaciens]MYT45150.1 aquaporin family protein [Streptomyces sp. SID5471]KEF03154.1 glycerol transporter [Streptomyces rimosus]KEF22406.1 glycerol transporter [Streptomyces rimosus]KOT35355.1 glycerol transporter [Streptomyces rimosus subsp. rimosus]
MYSNGDIFVGEVIGTALLILFGAGVCAAVTLHYSKARAAGWVVIAFGWGFGVLAGAYTAAPLSGGHLNPAVTLGSAVAGGTEWSKVPLYMAAQMVGALIGAVLAWALYYAQFAANAEADKAQPTLGIFSTAPEVRNPAANLVTETIATMGLVLPLLFFGQNQGIGIGQVPGADVGVYGSGINVLLVALLVVGIGLSLGGPTGYAINPARDLGPRIAHALLPIPNKGTSDWSYAWIPVAGPLLGAVLSGLVFNAVF